jgi:hypothetical protein
MRETLAPGPEAVNAVDKAVMQIEDGRLGSCRIRQFIG